MPESELARDYFATVEAAFLRRRGTVLLGPADWAIIESWEKQGVPLSVVVRGIDNAFDIWESKPRTRTIKSISYCSEEVAFAFEMWLATRVGAPVAAGAPADPKAVLRARVRRLCDALQRHPQLEAAAAVVSAFDPEVQDALAFEAVQAEVAALVYREASAADLERIEKDVRERLRPYRDRMVAGRYEETVTHLVRKVLCEERGLPLLLVQ